MARPALVSARAFVGYAAAAVLLGVFLRRAEWRILVAGVRDIEWYVLLGAIVVRFASLVAASCRWQALLAPARKVPVGTLVAAMMMGMAVNTAVSMQAAEFVRPYVLSRREGLGFATTFATVAVEWVLDLLGVAALFVPALLLLPSVAAARAGADINRALILLALLCLGSLGVLWLLPAGVARLGRRARHSTRVPDRLRERLAEQVELFAVGLRVLQRPRGVAVISAYSLVVPFLTAVSCWLALRAFGLPVSFLSGFLVLGLVTVGGIVPTPGAVGGFHAVCQFGLAVFFAFDPAQTVLPVLGLHAVLYVPSAAVGALCFAWARTEPGPRGVAAWRLAPRQRGQGE